MRNPSIALLGLLLSLTAGSAADTHFVVLVEAGDYERRDTIVTIAFPAAAGHPLALRRDGTDFPLQWENDGRATFRLDRLDKGALARYELKNIVPGGTHPFVTAVSNKTKLRLADTDRPRLEFQAEPGALPRDDIKPIFTRGGYLHPIVTPAGRVITDDFPPNHIHHHGVWWAWTHTEFQGRKPDFWNMGEGKGRVEFVALDQQWNGRVHAGFRSRQRFVDLTGGEPLAVLNETWEVKVFAAPAQARSWWMFDLTSEQRCSAEVPLRLPEYHYGGLGLRGHRAWNGKEAVNFLTSEGETDRVKGHATRARWCDMWGEIDGARAGLAILCHPGNFRAPQPMRLHPSEPFFCYAPQQLGDMEIKPSETYISRYRFVVHDGPPDRAELDRQWNDYAHPPVVRVEGK